MSNTYSTSLFKEKKQANQYRGMPFWALNGELDEEEIRRQIREFSQCGMGGFFLHARTGLSTEYLSEKTKETTTEKKPNQQNRKRNSKK